MLAQGLPSGGQMVFFYIWLFWCTPFMEYPCYKHRSQEPLETSCGRRSWPAAGEAVSITITHSTKLITPPSAFIGFPARHLSQAPSRQDLRVSTHLCWCCSALPCCIPDILAWTSFCASAVLGSNQTFHHGLHSPINPWLRSWKLCPPYSLGTSFPQVLWSKALLVLRSLAFVRTKSSKCRGLASRHSVP